MIETDDKSPREKIIPCTHDIKSHHLCVYVDLNGIFWWYQHENPIRRKEEKEEEKEEEEEEIETREKNLYFDYLRNNQFFFLKETKNDRTRLICFSTCSKMIDCVRCSILKSAYLWEKSVFLRTEKKKKKKTQETKSIRTYCSHLHMLHRSLLKLVWVDTTVSDMSHWHLYREHIVENIILTSSISIFLLSLHYVLISFFSFWKTKKKKGYWQSSNAMILSRCAFFLVLYSMETTFCHLYIYIYISQKYQTICHWLTNVIDHHPD